MNPYQLLCLPEINNFQQEKALDGLAILEETSKESRIIWSSPSYQRFIDRHFPNSKKVLHFYPEIFKTFINSHNDEFTVAIGKGRLECVLYKKNYENYIFLAVTELPKNTSQNYEEDRFSYILEGTGIGLWEWNIQTKEVRLSSEWARILGYELHELYPIGEHIWKDLCHPEDFDDSQHLFKKHFDGESHYYRGEARMRHANGKWIWVFDQGKVVTWKNNKPEWMVGYHREITNVKFQLEVSKTFIEESPVAIAMMDKNFNYLAASNKFLEDYGIPGGVEGKNHYELFNIPERWQAIHQECLKGAVRKNDEDSFIGRNGNVQYLQWLVKPWYDGDKVGGLIMQTSNLNRIKTLEIERLHNQQLLESIFENIEVGLLTLNTEGEIVLANNFIKEYFKIPGVTIHQNNWFKYFKIYSIDNTYKELKEVNVSLNKLASGDRFSNREIVLLGGNRKRYLRINLSPILDKLGNRSGSVLSVYDFTDNLEAEKNLRLSEQTFKASFEKAPIGMALVSTTGKWLQINARISNMLGYSEKELLELTFQDLTHPEDLSMDEQFVKLLIDNIHDDYQIEKRYIHKNGSIVYAILSVAIVRDSSKKPLFFVSQITDITELKKSKQELENVLTITRAQNDRLKNFAHIVSHNLRSHSGNIQMLLGMLTEDFPVLQENEIMRMVQKASKQLSETITHLNAVTVINTADDVPLQVLKLYDYVQRK